MRKQELNGLLWSLPGASYLEVGIGCSQEPLGPESLWFDSVLFLAEGNSPFRQNWKLVRFTV